MTVKLKSFPNSTHNPVGNFYSIPVWEVGTVIPVGSKREAERSHLGLIWLYEYLT